MCASGKNCIPNDYLCDGTTDCEDNDDELICHRKIVFHFFLLLINRLSVDLIGGRKISITQ